jgi:hypothetical protein
MNPKILIAILLNGLTLTAAGAADLVVTVKGVPDGPANMRSVRSMMRTTTASSMPIPRASQPRSMGSPPMVIRRVLPALRRRLSRLGTRPKPFPSSSGGMNPR